MPANLTPEYRAAEAAFRKARDLAERLESLREMLRVIPKHKGTDHLQGDIKRRIKELSEELERPKKGGARGGPSLVVRPEGAAQIALIGPPNAGKSSLHARLTGSGAHAAAYPFTTQYPEPGMMPHEDIHFQLVDLPAVCPEHPIPWLASALQTADASLLVMALDDPACLEQVEALRTRAAREARGSEPRMGIARGVTGRRARTIRSRFGFPRSCWRTGRTVSPMRTPSCAPSSTSRGSPIRRLRFQRRRDRASVRSAPGSSPISGSHGSTRRCQAALPRGIGRSSCAAARQWRTSPGSCTRTSHPRSGTPAYGAGPDSTDSMSDETIGWPTAMWSSSTRDGRRLSEPVDVVDEDDRIVATVTRAEVRAAPGSLHRATYVLSTERRPGEILVHRRTDGKDVFPGAYDMFSGGVCAAGESYDDCARREVARGIRSRGRRPAIPLQASLPGRSWPSLGQPCTRPDGTARCAPRRARWPGTHGSPPPQLDRMLGERPFCPDSREIFERLRGARAPSRSAEHPVTAVAPRVYGSASRFT